jgi:branched-chain amino acid transport system substrate-binding protein
MRRILPWLMVLAALWAQAAGAQETVKIAQIIPLSGPFAQAGEQLGKTFEFLIDRINAKGGMGGRKVEYSVYDSKLSPKESIIAAEKAIAGGARVVMAASGSSVAAALNDFIACFTTTPGTRRRLTKPACSGSSASRRTPT